MVDTYPRGTVSGEEIRRSVIELGKPSGPCGRKSDRQRSELTDLAN